MFSALRGPPGLLPWIRNWKMTRLCCAWNAKFHLGLYEGWTFVRTSFFRTKLGAWITKLFLSMVFCWASSGNFWIHTFFFPDSNRICTPTRIRHVSGFTIVHSTSLGVSVTEHASRLPFWTGIDFVTSPDKNISQFIVYTYPDSEQIQNFPLRRADSKRCGFVFRTHRIRVDDSRIRKENVADSKVFGYEWTEP